MNLQHFKKPTFAVDDSDLNTAYYKDKKAAVSNNIVTTYTC